MRKLTNVKCFIELLLEFKNQNQMTKKGLNLSYIDTNYTYLFINQYSFIFKFN